MLCWLMKNSTLFFNSLREARVCLSFISMGLAFQWISLQFPKHTLCNSRSLRGDSITSGLARLNRSNRHIFAFPQSAAPQPPSYWTLADLTVVWFNPAVTTLICPSHHPLHSQPDREHTRSESDKVQMHSTFSEVSQFTRVDHLRLNTFLM